MTAPWMAGLFPAVSLGRWIDCLMRAKARPCKQRHGSRGRFPHLLRASTSEDQLQSELEQPGITHFLRLAKSRALVSRIAVGPVELRMVENVENLRPKFQIHLFPHRGFLKYADIPIVDRRVAAQCTRHVAESARRNCTGIPGTGRGVAVVEQIGVEQEAIRPRIVGLERTGEVGLAGALKAEGASLQLGVIAVVDENGKTTLVGVDLGGLRCVKRITLGARNFSYDQLHDEVGD